MRRSRARQPRRQHPLLAILMYISKAGAVPVAWKRGTANGERERAVIIEIHVYS